MQDDLPGVKLHRKALARSLSMPDDTAALVTIRPRGFHGRRDGFANGVKPMVGGDDLVDFPTVRIVFKNNEVFQQVKEPSYGICL